ncbi:MAG: hypothetical protein HOE90_03770 [Bacteriovoracaceae bacterium]|jgi:hypothetical protein|nr:hypothetical protein [Bacteriovoracaceae bacterium]
MKYILLLLLTFNSSQTMANIFEQLVVAQHLQDEFHLTLVEKDDSHTDYLDKGRIVAREVLDYAGDFEKVISEGYRGYDQEIITKFLIRPGHNYAPFFCGTYKSMLSEDWEFSENPKLCFEQTEMLLKALLKDADEVFVLVLEGVNWGPQQEVVIYFKSYGKHSVNVLSFDILHEI